uniref:Voltage-dependent calcium channel alpha-2/delta subunit conserved region domain-containing protein n=1 Tax=Gouania willdenowi TaxID=441366 RepID=A0A8C5HME3_GOUWI
MDQIVIENISVVDFHRKKSKSNYFNCNWKKCHKQKKVEALVPCDTAYPGFMYERSINEANSLIKCGRCQKMFVVQQIPDSNLVMIVTQADCDCSHGLLTLDLCEHNATVKCNRMKSQKVRRRPESCHSYHPKENAKDCGGAASISFRKCSLSTLQ